MNDWPLMRCMKTVIKQLFCSTRENSFTQKENKLLAISLPHTGNRVWVASEDSTGLPPRANKLWVASEDSNGLPPRTNSQVLGGKLRFQWFATQSKQALGGNWRFQWFATQSKQASDGKWSSIGCHPEQPHSKWWIKKPLGFHQNKNGSRIK